MMYAGMQVLPYFYVRCGAVVPQQEQAAAQFLATFHAALDEHLQQLASSGAGSRSANAAATAAVAPPGMRHCAAALSVAASYSYR